MADDLTRPRTRGDCLSGGTNEARPCPWNTCKHSFMDAAGVTHCTLDFADKGGMTLEEIGDILGLTRERARQIEANALFKLKRKTAHLA